MESPYRERLASLNDTIAALKNCTTHGPSRLAEGADITREIRTEDDAIQLDEVELVADGQSRKDRRIPGSVSVSHSSISLPKSLAA